MVTPQTINDDLSKGYIVEVDKSDCFRTDHPREWYLPHHPVVHPHKPGKVRRVLNGAAKFHGHSLNKRSFDRARFTAKLDSRFVPIPTTSLRRFRRH